jgi:hypothetical protein
MRPFSPLSCNLTTPAPRDVELTVRIWGRGAVASLCLSSALMTGLLSDVDVTNVPYHARFIYQFAGVNRIQLLKFLMMPSHPLLQSLCHPVILGSE